MKLQHVTPESVGIPSCAVTAMLEELYAQGIEMHSFMLLRHGKVCAQGAWKPYAMDEPHIMFSFSKSLTSTAIGFARQEGLLSLDERLVDLFPDKCPAEPGGNLQKATVRHLLMMGCGHETEIDWGPNQENDWIADFLHHPFVFEPGTHFLYNTAGTNMLCAILKLKTGLSLTEFLKPRLFEPLGMSDVQCHQLPNGISMGGAGCWLTIEDMARFVQFVANRGQWEGKQLLGADWFEMATGKQIENAGAGWGGDPDWQQGYCFQFWRCAPKGVFRGDGAFGQYGIVMAEQDAVLVIQSASMKLQAVLTAVWEKLLPAMAEGELPADHKGLHVLENRLKNLELNPMLGMRSPGAEESLEEAVYVPEGAMPGLADIIGGVGRFTREGGRLQELALHFDEKGLQLTGRQDNGAFTLDVGMQGHFAQSRVNGVLYGANGRWRAKDKLEIEVRNTRTVAGKRFTLQFAGDKLRVNADSTIPEIGGLGEPLMEELCFTLKEGEVSTKTKMYWEVNG